jgi:AcrR family transcriptional regulator
MIRSPSAARKRLYRQVARAHATQETERKILAAATELLTERHYEDVSLEDIAAHAGISSKTVKRRFGTKDALSLQVIEAGGRHNAAMRDAVPAGDVEAALGMIYGMYEVLGDVVLRYLAAEARIPMMKAMGERGRDLHLAWVARVFGPLCAPDEARRRVQLALLVVATDVYCWKLLRRDRGFSPEETIGAARELVHAALEPRPRSKKGT